MTENETGEGPVAWESERAELKKRWQQIAIEISHSPAGFGTHLEKLLRIKQRLAQIDNQQRTLDAEVQTFKQLFWLLRGCLTGLQPEATATRAAEAQLDLLLTCEDPASLQEDPDTFRQRFKWQVGQVNGGIYTEDDLLRATRILDAILTGHLDRVRYSGGPLPPPMHKYHGPKVKDNDYDE